MNKTYKAKIAVQLYSIHQYTKAVGLKKTIEDVAKIGYAGVEFAGYWDFSSAELKKMLDDNGLVACGTHVSTDAFKGDVLKAACEFNLGFGNNLLICPGGGNGLPKDWDKPADDWWKYLADFYAKVADEAAKFGCRVGLHNHAWEFQNKLSDGTLMWDYFFSNTPKSVVMEQDVGWTTYAGFDPCEQYVKYPGRSITLHAKENGLHEEGYDAILGKPAPGAKGVEWEKLFPVAEKDGVEWYVVECEQHFDSLEAIAPSYEFLKPYLQA